MKSMLFAAGLGTRLMPLTKDRPKAMVEVAGKPLLQWSIERLINAGSKEIIINVHHFAEMIISFLESRNNFGARIEISDERENVLETGGGLKKAQWFFDDDKPFIVQNVDVLTNLDLKSFYEFHLSNNALATLAVRRRMSSRYLIFNSNNQLIGWKNTKTGEVKSHLSYSQIESSENTLDAFSGIQIMDPRIFKYFLEEEKFSIIDVYLNAMKKEKIMKYTHDMDYWLDVGRPESLQIANQSNWLKH